MVSQYLQKGIKINFSLKNFFVKNFYFKNHSYLSKIITLYFILNITSTFGISLRELKKIDSLETKAKNLQTGIEKAEIYYQISYLYRNFDSKKSYDYGEKILEIAKKIPDKKAKILALVAMGSSLHFEGEDVKGVKFYTEAIALAREINDYSMISECLRGLFYIYYMNNNIEKAKYYLNEKKQIDLKYFDNDRSKAINADLFGLVYEEEKKYELAYENYKIAKYYAAKIKDSILLSAYTNNLAIIHNFRKNYDSAIFYHKEAIKINKLINEGLRVGYVTNWLAKTFHAKGNLDSALYYAKRGLDLSLNGGPPNSKQLGYEILYKIYKSKGDFQKALTFHEKYDSITSEILNVEKTKAILSVENKYKLAQLDQAIQLQEHEIMNKNLLIYFFTILALLTGLSTYIFYFKNKEKKKLNTLLSDQKKELYEQNQEIEAQNEEISAINKHLEDIVESRTKQLKENENLLMLSQSLAKLGSWVLNIESSRFKWSNETYKIFEVDEESIPDLEMIISRMEEEKSKELKTKIETCIKDESPFDFDFNIISKNGLTKHLTTFWIPFRVENTQKVTELRGCVQDITELKESQIQFVNQTQQLIESNKKMAEFKLMALRSVMNPHFLFNSLNSIQYFIAKNIKEEALDYLSQFSKLMRIILNSSINNYITLAQEVEMLKLYVKLESLRFNKFSTEFIIDPDLDIEYIEIPSLLIQPFVENAILHGLSNLPDDKGELKITFKKVNDKLFCSIDDNGIGRKASMELKQNKTHKSIGMLVTTERINLSNEGEVLAINVIDKSNEKGESTGTTVELILEIDIKE